MAFIVTLIVLAIERFFDWTHLRNWNWFARWQQLISRKISPKSPYVVLALYVLPIVIVVALIDLLLSDTLYGLLRLIFDVVVLLYCLGPNNVWAHTYACIAELNKNSSKDAIEKIQKNFHINDKDGSQLHKSFTRAIFIEAFQRIFAVIFWFAILGPAGAILYRTVTYCYQENTDFHVNFTALYVKQVLDWIPARIFTLLFALGGHFIQVITRWKKQVLQKLSSSNDLIADCGVAALDVVSNNIFPEDGSAENEALRLLDRTFIITLVILALIALF